MIDWDSYTAALGANIRAERSRIDMSQKELAERMRELGFSQWSPTLVAKLERNNRPLLAVEAEKKMADRPSFPAPPAVNTQAARALSALDTRPSTGVSRERAAKATGWEAVAARRPA